MRKRAVFALFSLSLMALIFGVLPPQAQADISDTDISVSLNPTNPGPNQDITATINSYTIDLQKTKIVWLVSGKIADSGVGETSYSFRSGNIGSKTTVTFRLMDGSSVLFERNILVAPADVDLIWESDSYVPPFYKGKALPGSEATIKVVALPNIKDGNKILGVNDFTFNWKRNYENKNQYSGYAKNVYYFKNSFLNPSETISVGISGVTTDWSTSKSFNLTTRDPDILFYERLPLQGIDFRHIISNDLRLSQIEQSIVAIPYYFSAATANSSDLTYTWRINGKSTDTTFPHNVLTIQKNDNDSGNANISLNIESANRLFQAISKNLSISF